MSSLQGKLLAPQERELLEGAYGRNLQTLFQDIVTGKTINPNHFEDLTNKFGQMLDVSTRVIGGYGYENILFENEKFSPNAHFSHTLTTASRLPHSSDEDNDQLISLNRLNVTNGGVFLASRALPILVRWGHIEKRLNERKTRNWTLGDPTIFTSIYLAMAMVQIMDWQDNPPETTPIVLPAKDGLFVGFISPLHNSWMGNRMMFNASIAPEFSLERYKWLPRFRTNIWTYLGMEELHPEQQRLRYQLSEFFSPSRTHDLQLIYDEYHTTISDNNYESDPRRAGYERQVEKLLGIMNSDLWGRAVRLSSDRYKRDPRSLTLL